MSTIRSSMICDRVRAQISLELDGELSQLERAMVAAHVERCADCRTYEGEVTSFTSVLRAAPLEQMDMPIVVRRPRRAYAGRLQAGVAAAVAMAALGVATQISEPQSGVPSPSRNVQIKYPSQQQIEREQVLLESMRSGMRLQLDGFVL